MPINLARVIRGLDIFDKGASDVEIQVLVGSADPNGAVTASQGSLFLRSNGTLYQNTDGATTWAAFSTGGGSAAEEGFIRAFIGKNGAGAETPDYNASGVVGTVNTIGNNDNLELAVAKLDVRVGANLTPEARANNQLVAANTVMQLISALDQAIGNDAQLASTEYIAAINTIYHQHDLPELVRAGRPGEVELRRYHHGAVLAGSSVPDLG
jgi:hypothetical protein